MKTLPGLLTSLILAGWIGAIAILSVQNFTPVSFQLFGIQSIQIPFGLVLAFSVGLGAVGTAIVQVLIGNAFSQEEFEDE
ncbi:MAG: DUF1049 domain-containing protein [Leptolyngbyaceae cyanobacterium RU_5_1]|nr:DUF1049 domain-containing protein [Leptolyngbyaceae cyanobacterium RU_5_1]